MLSRMCRSGSSVPPRRLRIVSAIAAKSASFIQAFCRLGLVPDSGGTWFLPRLVGRAQAMGLAMLGDKVPAEQALQLGMIWQVVEDDQLKAEAEKMADLVQHGFADPLAQLGLC